MAVEAACSFCGSSQPVLPCDSLVTGEAGTAHYFCLLFSSGLEQRGGEGEGLRGFLAQDIRRELRRGQRLKCSFCKKKGATVGCAEASCKKSYHLDCGASHGCLLQYFGQFRSLCSRHRPAQPRPGRRPAAQPPHRCAVCQEVVVVARRGGGVLYSPCCAAVSHRSCLQDHALAPPPAPPLACPACNEGPTFTQEMREHGVYVPEPAEEAFTTPELRARAGQEAGQEAGQGCCAKLCFCPEGEGRAHRAERGRWALVQCASCSQGGIHVGCGGVADLPAHCPAWHCYTCRPGLVAAGRGDVLAVQSAALAQLYQEVRAAPAPPAPPRNPAKISHTTSFTELLGSLLDSGEGSPADSDYESDRLNSLPV